MRKFFIVLIALGLVGVFTLPLGGAGPRGTGSGALQWTFVELLRPGGACASPNADNGAYGLHGWKLPPTGLSYSVNTGSIPKDLKANTAGVLAAIDAAVAAWAGAPPLVNGGVTTKKAGFRDGVNAVDFGGGAYGAVAVAWIASSGGVVQEADMRFATSGWKWATNETATGDCGGADGRWDITDVGAHEFGHWVGAAHTSGEAVNNAQTMFPYVSYKELFKRTLASGDITAVTTIY